MKKILVVSKDYKPISNGSVTCLENILEILKEKYSIDVVCLKESENIASFSDDDGVDIVRLFSKFDKPMIHRINKMKELENTKKYSLFKNFSKYIYAPFYFLANKKGLLYEIGWTINATHHIDEVVKVEDYDIILTIGAPFSNVKVSYELAIKYNKPLYIIQFDLYTYNPTHDLADKEQVKVRLVEESKWYEYASQIFITKEMESTVYQSPLKQYDDKITVIQTPNFLPFSFEQDGQVSNEIRILYTGMFYENIRNPKKMFEVFSEIIANNPQVIFEIVGHGCEELIYNFQNKWPNNVVFYGKKSKQFVISRIANANILLNLSNATNKQAPSKIIEYITTCKPIINVFSIDDDLCLNILRDYSLSISIDERKDIAQSVKEIQEFIENNKTSRMDYENVYQKYYKYSPQYVGKKINQMLCKKV